MESDRSVDDNKFMALAREVISEEHDFLEEIGRLGLPKRKP